MDLAFAKRFACIVGAPRTGTTSLAQYLRAHPSVCFSKLKEPHFFSQRDLDGLPVEELREIVSAEYLQRYFPDRDDDRPLLAEGSVTYLYTPERMRPILRLWPNAKFIIGLRDPIEMIPSLHQRLLVLGDETVRDFEKAWRLVGERKEGRCIPSSCIEPRWLRYDQLGRLGQYVEQFISVVGRDRCFFVIHDDLRADPVRVYHDLLDFLDLPQIALANPKPRRTGRSFKHGWLQRLLMRPPIVTRRLLAGDAYRRRFGKIDRVQKPKPKGLQMVERARKRLLKWNEAEAVPTSLSDELREEFRALYRDDVAHLEEIVGRDLGHWLSAN